MLTNAMNETKLKIEKEAVAKNIAWVSLGVLLPLILGLILLLQVVSATEMVEGWRTAKIICSVLFLAISGIFLLPVIGLIPWVSYLVFADDDSIEEALHNIGVLSVTICCNYEVFWYNSEVWAWGALTTLVIGALVVVDVVILA